MFAILIIGLIAGPAVSLYGSPTVSPVIAAAWASSPSRRRDRPRSSSSRCPSSAAGRHRDCEEEAGDDRPDEEGRRASRRMIPTTIGISTGIGAGTSSP